MPADVMPTSFQTEQFLASTSGAFVTPLRCDPEAKCGSVVLEAPDGRRQGVQVNVYRTSLEHFAVIYPQKKVCKPLGVLNLRNASVEPTPGGFVVHQRGFDNTSTLIFWCEREDVDSWVSAFASRTSASTSTCLPVLEEIDEN